MEAAHIEDGSGFDRERLFSPQCRPGNLLCGPISDGYRASLGIKALAQGEIIIRSGNKAVHRMAMGTHFFTGSIDVIAAIVPILILEQHRGFTVPDGILDPGCIFVYTQRFLIQIADGQREHSRLSVRPAGSDLLVQAEG